MRLLPLLLLALLPLGCADVTATDAVAPPQVDEPTAFVDVTVLPMNGEGVLEHHTVVVEGDRITAVGPVDEVAVPEGAQRIDGASKFLMPGLAEMHGHIPPPSAPEAFVEDVLFLYVANGITTVRGMLGSDGQLALKARANSGQLIAPTLYLAGPSFNGNSVDSPEQAEAMVRRQVEEGWDLLKIHPGLTRAEYDAMAETANALGIRFGGHVPQDVGLLHALAMNQETFDHLDGYVEYLMSVDDTGIDDEALAEVIQRTLDAGAWVVPTMALWETLYGVADLETLTAFPELQYMPPSQVAQWTDAHRRRLASPQLNRTDAQRVIDVRMQVLGALYEAGVPILMGTDAPQQFSVPGFSLHRELERMEAAGMPPDAVLASGTDAVGRYFGDQDTFGHVAAGHRADLLLLDANPLDDLANLTERSGVMVRGRWIPETEIQDRLAAITARHQD